MLMQKPSVVDSPSGGAPTKAPRWDIADTEGYGDGNCFSLAPQMFSGYVGIYRRKKYIGGCLWSPEDRGAPRGWARPLVSWSPRKLLDLHSKFSGSRLFQKSRSRRFHSVWTLFNIPFLRNTEIGKKTRVGPPVSRLVQKMIIMYKIKPINIQNR